MVFKDSRLKIERAEKHIADIKSRVRALHESQTSSIEMHVAAGGETLKYEFDDTSALTDIALMLGDAIHNLNCALDYAWLQTVERLVPSAVNDRAKFPVYKTINELEGSLKKANVQTAPPALFHFMM